MNKIHRVIWSQVRQAYVVTHEKAATRGKPSSTRNAIAAGVTAALLGLGGPAMAVCPDPVGNLITVDATVAGQCQVSYDQSLHVTDTGELSGPGIVQPTVRVPSGGVTAVDITNDGTISSTDAAVIQIATGSTLSSLTNNGTISSSWMSGPVIDLNIGSTLTTLNNTGLITGASTYARTLIQVASGATLGSLTNSGTIENAGGGIWVATGGTLGSLVNTVDGTISSSWGSIWINGTVENGIENHGTLTANSSGAIVIGTSGANATANGGILNSGTISGVSSYGILIQSSSTVNGGISNSGTISGGAGRWRSGIGINSSTLNGGLNNAATGVIDGMIGVYLTSATLDGGIINQGRINGIQGAGIYAWGSSITGNIENRGTASEITRAGNDTLGYAAIHLTSSTLNGSIINEGTISGSADPDPAWGTIWDGIRISNVSTVTGDIINSGAGSVIRGGRVAAINIDDSIVGGTIRNEGLISSTSTGRSAISISRATVGAINNQGTIAGGSSSISIERTSTITGAFTNGGTITSASGAGVYISSASTINGGFFNNGDILAEGSYGTGIYLGSSTINGGLENTGTIAYSGEGTWGAGISLSSGTINGGLVNTGTISAEGTWGAGIQLNGGSSITGGLTNSGTIRGENYAILVGIGSGVDNLIIAGNDTARFIGTVDAPDTPMSIAAGATYTLRGDDDFRVASFTNNGTARFDSAGEVTPSFDLSGVTDNTFTNNGVLELAAGTTGTLFGDYTQTADGVLRSQVTNDTTYGQLVVDGVANVGATMKIDVDVSDPNFSFTTAVTNGMPEILRATSITGGDAFVVTDNSFLFDFDAVKEGNAIHLTLAEAPEQDHAEQLVEIVTTAGNSVAGPAASVLGDLIDRYLASSGADETAANFAAIIDAIAAMSTAEEINAAVSQTLPLLTGGSQRVTGAAISGVRQIIRARRDALRGLSSGDTFYGDKHVWLKPFGSWAEQDGRNGESGFDADTMGLAMGIDGTLQAGSRVGVAFSYAKANSESRSALQPHSADIAVYQLVGYGSHDLDERTEINFQVGYGQNMTKGTRGLPAFNLTARSDYDSEVTTAGVGIERVFSMNQKTRMTPSVRADYTGVRDDGYTETGAGALNLIVAGRNSSELVLAVDGNLTHEFRPGSSLSANLGVGYDMLAEKTQITSAFAGAPGASFTTEGLEPDPWLFRGGVGLSSAMQSGMETSVRYDADYRKDYLNQTVSLNLRWALK